MLFSSPENRRIRWAGAFAQQHRATQFLRQEAWVGPLGAQPFLPKQNLAGE
jgi:hypothetical protein